MIGVQQDRWLLRYDGAQNTLSFQQRPGPLVLAIEPEQVKYVENWLATPAHQIIEARATLRIQYNDLAIKDCFAVQFGANGSPQIRKALHETPALREQAGFVLPDVCDCSEAIHLQFEYEVFVIEGIADELRIGRNE